MERREHVQGEPRKSRSRLGRAAVFAGLVAGVPMLAVPAFAASSSGSVSTNADVAAIAAKVDPAIVDINTTLGERRGGRHRHGAHVVGRGAHQQPRDRRRHRASRCRSPAPGRPTRATRGRLRRHRRRRRPPAQGRVGPADGHDRRLGQRRRSATTSWPSATPSAGAARPPSRRRHGRRRSTRRSPPPTRAAANPEQLNGPDPGRRADPARRLGRPAGRRRRQGHRHGHRRLAATAVLAAAARPRATPSRSTTPWPSPTRSRPGTGSDTIHIGAARHPRRRGAGRLGRLQLAVRRLGRPRRVRRTRAASGPRARRRAAPATSVASASATWATSARWATSAGWATSAPWATSATWARSAT